MAKREARKNDSDYIRFRPYHAFTAAPPKAEGGGSKIVWGIVLMVAIFGALLVAVVMLMH